MQKLRCACSCSWFYMQYFMDQCTSTYSHMQQKMLDTLLKFTKIGLFESINWWCWRCEIICVVGTSMCSFWWRAATAHINIRIVRFKHIKSREKASRVELIALLFKFPQFVLMTPYITMGCGFEIHFTISLLFQSIVKSYVKDTRERKHHFSYFINRGGDWFYSMNWLIK